MAPTPASRNFALAMLFGGSVLLSGGAVFFSLNNDDVVGSLFANVVTIQILGALVAWALLAWLARRLTIGRVPENALGSFWLIWGGFRISLLIAVLALLCGWLVALALGHSLQMALLRALVLLVVITALTGIMGEAFFNSSLAIGRWFGRTRVGAD